jgi:hypothetical protein
MRYLVTTEALMSGTRATTSTGPGLDRPSMASWTPEHQPVTGRSLKVFAVWASVKRRARPPSLSLIRLASRLACAGVAAMCPLQEMVDGTRFTPIRLGR